MTCAALFITALSSCGRSSPSTTFGSTADPLILVHWTEAHGSILGTVEVHVRNKHDVTEHRYDLAGLRNGSNLTFTVSGGGIGDKETWTATRKGERLSLSVPESSVTPLSGDIDLKSISATAFESALTKAQTDAATTAAKDNADAAATEALATDAARQTAVSHQLDAAVLGGRWEAFVARFRPVAPGPSNGEFRTCPGIGEYDILMKGGPQALPQDPPGADGATQILWHTCDNHHLTQQQATDLARPFFPPNAIQITDYTAPDVAPTEQAFKSTALPVEVCPTQEFTFERLDYADNTGFSLGCSLFKLD